MHRPVPSLPFTVTAEPGVVHLVAGEDVRYALRGEGIDRLVPRLIRACDGRRTVAELLEDLDPDVRDDARSLLERLESERVLVEGSAEAAHEELDRPLVVHGAGPVAESLHGSPVSERAVHVFCQDSLDFSAAREFNRERLADLQPFLWVTTGPMARGFVGPLFRPGVGPCLTCLLTHFRRLSPVPDLYGILEGHVKEGGEVTPVPFPRDAAVMLASLVRWKHEECARHTPPLGLYRLHVLEVATMSISTHPVVRDPECEDCRHVSGP